MPQGSSSAGTGRKGIIVLLNCHDFSNAYVRVYTPYQNPDKAENFPETGFSGERNRLYMDHRFRPESDNKPAPCPDLLLFRI